MLLSRWNKATLLACAGLLGLSSPALGATPIDLTVDPSVDFVGGSPSIVSRTLTGSGQIDFLGDIADQTLGLADVGSFLLDLTYTINFIGGSSAVGTYHFTKADLSAFAVTFTGLTTTAVNIVTDPVAPTSGSITAPLSFTVNRNGDTDTNDVAFYLYPTSGQALIANGSFDAALAPAVPEPATWAMMLAGLGAIAWGVRRRRAPASTGVPISA